MSASPRVGSTSPVEAKQDQGTGADEEEGANRIHAPDVFSDTHLRIIGSSCRMVEGNQPDKRRGVEGSLHPELEVWGVSFLPWE